MVSGRTDIVAFYNNWFINRYEEGYVDVRNPFYPKKISRIYFKDVDLILFCTKNPIPIIDYLKNIKQPILFHITLTPYKNDIEPNIPPKGDIIEAIKQVSKIVGIENIYVRYDPILINDIYTIDYHIKSFKSLCAKLNGYVKHIIVSFVDDYKNVRNNKDVLKLKEFNENDYKSIGINFSEIASKYNITIQTCAEENDLFEYGFIKEDCIGKELAYKLTGKKFKKWNGRHSKFCNCVNMADIGVYNSCKHFCKYCYANYDEKQVIDNYKNHDPNSSLLVGNLQKDDEIVIRKD